MARSLTRIFRIHMLSKKSRNDTMQQGHLPEVDVMGIILMSETEESLPSFPLGHKSGLLLRIQCDSDHQEQNSLLSGSPLARDSIESPTLVVFRDIQVLPFDAIMESAIAVLKNVQLRSLLGRNECRQFATMDDIESRIRSASFACCLCRCALSSPPVKWWPSDISLGLKSLQSQQLLVQVV